MSDVLAPVDWTVAFTEHYSKICNYIYRHTSDYTLSEDLASETFVKAIEYDQRDKGAKDSFRGWLYRIAHNLIIDHYRARERRKSISIDDVPNTVDPNGDPVKEAERTLDVETLNSALRYLTPEQLQAVTLRYIEGLRFDEIASMMGKNEPAVKALIHRAFDIANTILTNGGTRAQQKHGCWKDAQNVLRAQGPMIVADLALEVHQTKASIAFALYSHPQIFTKVDHQERGKMVIWVWGLVGIHDQKEAA